MNSYGSAKYNQSDSQPGTNRRVFSLKVLLLASLASLSNAIALNAATGSAGVVQLRRTHSIIRAGNST